MERLLMTALSCVVVWYNPSEKELKNIESYYGHLERIYIIDNSDNNNSELIDSIDLSKRKIKYFPNYSNLGIASALNKGCISAIENGSLLWIRIPLFLSMK